VGLRALGAQTELLRAYEAYVHNEFAKLYNARRFDEARQIVETGLSEYPASRTLSADLQTVKKAQEQ
jgi:hypothetical protein